MPLYLTVLPCSNKTIGTSQSQARRLDQTCSTRKILLRLTSTREDLNRSPSQRCTLSQCCSLNQFRSINKCCSLSQWGSISQWCSISQWHSIRQFRGISQCHSISQCRSISHSISSMAISILNQGTRPSNLHSRRRNTPSLFCILSLRC